MCNTVTDHSKCRTVTVVWSNQLDSFERLREFMELYFFNSARVARGYIVNENNQTRWKYKQVQKLSNINQCDTFDICINRYHIYLEIIKS